MYINSPTKEKINKYIFTCIECIEYIGTYVCNVYREKQSVDMFALVIRRVGVGDCGAIEFSITRRTRSQIRIPIYYCKHTALSFIYI